MRELVFLARLLGLVGLVLLTAVLFFHALIESARGPGAPVPGTILFIAIVGLLYVLGRESLTWVKSKEKRRPFERRDFFNFLAVSIGTLATFLLSADLFLGPVTAAGLVGIIGALILPKYAVPIYCGAFAGMACPEIFQTVALVSAAGIFAGLFYVLAGEALAGFGGKLGTIAFGGTLAAIYLGGQRVYGQAIPPWSIGWLVVVLSLAATLATYLLSVRGGHGPVMASGAVGLTGGLILPALMPETGHLLAVMVICSSFAGMSSPARVGNLKTLFLAGLVCGLAFIYTAPCFGGTGGKLGTIAFGSVISARGIIDLFQRRHNLGRQPATKNRKAG